MQLPDVDAALLAQHNGQGGSAIWLVYRGLVYDVSASRLWQRGLHYGHPAGEDLTRDMPDAPHTAQVLADFPVVGRWIG